MTVQNGCELVDIWILNELWKRGFDSKCKLQIEQIEQISAKTRGGAGLFVLPECYNARQQRRQQRRSPQREQPLAMLVFAKD